MFIGINFVCTCTCSCDVIRCNNTLPACYMLPVHVHVHVRTYVAVCVCVSESADGNWSDLMSIFTTGRGNNGQGTV